MLLSYIKPYRDVILCSIKSYRHSILSVCACRCFKTHYNDLVCGPFVFGAFVTKALSLTQDSPLVVVLGSCSKYQSCICGVRKVKCYLIILIIVLTSFANFLPLWSFAGLQKIPPLVRPCAGGAVNRRDGNEGRHHAAREVSRQGAAGHSSGSRTWLCQPGDNLFCYLRICSGEKT